MTTNPSSSGEHTGNISNNKNTLTQKQVDAPVGNTAYIGDSSSSYSAPNKYLAIGLIVESSILHIGSSFNKHI